MSKLPESQMRKPAASPRSLARGWENLFPSGYTGGVLEETGWRRLNELLFKNYGHFIIWLIERHIKISEYHDDVEDYLQMVLLTNMRCLRNRMDVVFRLNLHSWLILMVTRTIRERQGWRRRVIVDFHGMQPVRPGVWRQTPPWRPGPRWDSFRNMSVRDFYEI